MMQPKEVVKIKAHSYFLQMFNKKLVQPCSVIEPLASLCGGWYLQTFKQVINKLNKNKSSPLPLFFPSADNMEAISKNKSLLRNVFKVFDTRGFNRIDASQLYSACLTLSKGSYQTYLKTIVDIFGFQNSGRINRNQFFFFLDSFYRSLPKILISRQKMQKNIRLDFKDINKFLDCLFDEQKIDIERNEIYQAMMKVAELNDFMKYIQKRCMVSAQNSRNEQIQRIRIETEVRKCLVDVILKVQASFEKK